MFAGDSLTSFPHGVEVAVARVSTGARTSHHMARCALDVAALLLVLVRVYIK